MLSTLKPSA